MTAKEFQNLDIKKIRCEIGLNQLEMARELGISLNAYRLWESHCCRNPKPENLAKLDEIVQNITDKYEEYTLKKPF